MVGIRTLTDQELTHLPVTKERGVMEVIIERYPIKAEAMILDEFQRGDIVIEHEPH